jgi:hypothetical protein
MSVFEEISICGLPSRIMCLYWAGLTEKTLEIKNAKLQLEEEGKTLLALLLPALYAGVSIFVSAFDSGCWLVVAFCTSW